MSWTDEDRLWMSAALEQARLALTVRETPVGCVFVKDKKIIGQGHNETNATRNGTRHAELVAIDKILKDHGGSSDKCGWDRVHLYVTCEPCIMCAGALALLGIASATYGCSNDKFGGTGSILSVHETGCGGCGGTGSMSTYPSRGGLCAEDAVDLLRAFYVAGNPAAPQPHRAPRHDLLEELRKGNVPVGLKRNKQDEEDD
eukprot:jgi/Ulvmu1/5642/UM231_0005.1